MSESDKEKTLTALGDLSETCKAALSALRATTAYEQAGTQEITSVLRNDAISIHRLVYSNTTRLSIALGKPPPSYDIALVPIKDLNTEVGQLVSCVSLFSSRLLRREIAWAAEETIQALSSLSNHFLDRCQKDITSSDEGYLAKTGAVHQAVRKAETVSENEFAAFTKAWKLNGEGIKDSLREVKQLLEERPDDDNLDENDGWDDALGDSMPKLSETETERVKKLFPLFRFTTLLHDKILSDHISHLRLSKIPEETISNHLSSLLTFSNSILMVNDDLASALYAPQDLDNIRECVDLVMGTVHDFDRELGITKTKTNITPDELAESLECLTLGHNNNESTKWFQKCLQQIDKFHAAAGPIPNHIAFVMDGNRRFADKLGKRPIEGHVEGFSALRRVLEISYKLGVRSVSVYAFAIDNFRRSPEEVNGLMDLFEENLRGICKRRELLDKYNVRLNILGKTTLFPERVRLAVEMAQQLTKNNKSVVLNVMMPYASRDEITTAMQTVGQKVINSDLSLSTVTEDDINAELFTTKGGNDPVEVLIRTSGVRRFSDFLMWQCCEDVQIHFTPVYWPDFGLRQFIPIILDYQRKIWSRKLLIPQ